MASTSGSVTNPSTGYGYPYPNTLTVNWSVTSSTSSSHTIHWSLVASGGASGYSQYFFNTSVWISFDGGASLEALTYNRSGNISQGGEIASGNYTISHTTEKSFWLRVGGGYYSSANYAENTAGWTLPALATPPTGLSVSSISATSNTVTGTVSITGWGTNPTSGRYLELNISASKSTDSDKRRYQTNTQGDTSLSAVLTCSSSSHGTMTIQPNKLYYIGAYATNGAANTGVQWNWGSVVTKPDKLSSATVLEFDRSSATVRCVPSTNDGGQYTRSLKYSLNGGATVDAGTISATKEITVTGLAAGVTNTITLWITTTAGDSATIQVQIAAQQAIGFYVSRNDVRKKTIEAYCSPSGTRKRVLKAYYSVGGVRKLFYES